MISLLQNFPTLGGDAVDLCVIFSLILSAFCGLMYIRLCRQERCAARSVRAQKLLPYKVYDAQAQPASTPMGVRQAIALRDLLSTGQAPAQIALS